ncbi:MAG: translation initiation factor [Planctomycetes bacterium]|nr:translation initiation factor [Planctomycetota bacterium]
MTHNPFRALAGGRGEAPAPAPRPPEVALPAPRRPSPSRRCSRASSSCAKEAKGRGGKTVTCIAGLGGAEAEREALARELRKALGAGARVEGDELVVQGALVERVASWLEARGAQRVVRGNA